MIVVKHRHEKSSDTIGWKKTICSTAVLLQIACCLLLLPAVSSAQKIAAGGQHSLAVCIDSTTQSWGYDFYGQLGDDAGLADKPTPVQVAGLTGIIAISGGWGHSLALKSDGTVWAWGLDSYGALGNDAVFEQQSKPVAVAGLTGIIAIASGEAHSLALDNTGKVWSWGDDKVGQLGDGAALVKQSMPVRVVDLTGIIAIAAAESHSLALKKDGTVWSWGYDAGGQLGNDAILANKPTPVRVAALTGITAISTGWWHSLALKNDGTVWAWGHDNYGQLGDNADLEGKPTPVRVAALKAITAVAAGGGNGFALDTAGKVWSWGWDFFGQLGNNRSLANKPMPVQVADLTGVTAIAGGSYHSLAVKNDGTLWTWGRDNFGQLGNDAILVNKPVPVQVRGGCAR